MKYICDNCKSKGTYIKPFTTILELNGASYNVVGDRRFCSKCDNPVYDPVLDNSILKEIIRKKDEILGTEPNNNSERELTVFNGYNEFRQEKVISIIKYLTKKGMLKTKLLKELFYIDFLYYKSTAQSLTGLEYIKYPQGPVPNGYEEILEDLANNDNDINLSKDELEIVNKVKDFFDKYTVSEIAEFSHKEKAFINTKQFNKIEYDYAFDMNL